MPVPWKRNMPPQPSPDEKQPLPTAKIVLPQSSDKEQPDYSKAPLSSLKRMGRYVPIQEKDKVIHPVIQPFYKLERQLEKILGWLQSLAGLEILSLIGNFGLIIAVATYIGSEKQRRNAEVLNAWQTITSAHGQAGSGGRIQALEFLNASPGANWRRKLPWFCAPSPICLWPAESLDGLNLSVESSENVVENGQSDLTENSPAVVTRLGVYLQEIQLPRANLKDANLARAVLSSANLKGADLLSANLEGADLASADLEGSVLGAATLKGANLWSANLERAVLVSANLEGAVLVSANLEGANLWSADLKGTNLWYANLEGAEKLTTEQLTQAKLCQTRFSEDIDLPPNRDCEELERTLDLRIEHIEPQ